jgi:hypothetical protein
MTATPTAAVAGHAGTVPPEAAHRHDSACFWDVDGCRWLCTTYPLVRYALEHGTAIARPVADRGSEAGW